MRSKVLLLLFAAFVCHPASATCAPRLPFCEALPDRSNPNRAIFVGLINETIPAPPQGPRAVPNTSSSAAPQGRQVAGSRPIEPSMHYPTVRLRVVEAFSGVALGDFSVRLTSDLFGNDEPL